MPADTSLLTQPFQATYLRLLHDCRQNGTPMVAFFTVRHPLKQARMWRQSRSRYEVEMGIRWLRGAGALWLADVLDAVGPQFGRWATNAAPGNSWHQWAKASDAYAEVDGCISWDTRPGAPGGPGDAYYRFYAERAIELGLRPLGPTLGDWVHVQEPQENAPADVMPWPKIDAEMRRLFGP